MPFITKNKTNWKFILIIIVLAIIVGGGTLWLIKNSFIFTLEFPISKKTEITNNKIADWNTYRNEKYKYEIQYPKDWNFFEGGQETDPAVLDITRFFTKTLINSVVKIRVYQNPGENYQKILRGEENAPNPRAVERINNNYHFLISYFGEKEGIEIFEKMVSAFKFIE